MNHPLRAFEVLKTDQVEVARTALIEKYGATTFELRNPNNFEAQASFVSLNGLALSYCHYSTAVQLRFPEADFVRQHICLSGGFRATQGNVLREANAQHWSALIEPERGVAYSYAPDTTQLVVWFDISALQSKVDALTGTSSDRRLDFRSGQREPSEASLQGLRRAINFAVAEIDLAGSTLAPVAISEIEDLVAVRFLVAYWQEQTTDVTQPAPLPSREQLGKLEEYLAENWHQPLNVEAMAQISNVSARSVFRYFRDIRGCTPNAFLKQIRLQQARSALAISEPGATVMSIALRCGFSSMGHFARDYQSAFGELPFETLGGSKQK